jgi:hypothetical protein
MTTAVALLAFVDSSIVNSTGGARHIAAPHGVTSP